MTMTTYTPKLLALSLLTASVVSFTATMSAATGLIDFEFDEGTGTKVTDSINSLVGVPGAPANPPTFTNAAPSGKSGDFAIHFEAGQYMTVNDPDTRVRLDTNNPSFTLDGRRKRLNSSHVAKAYFVINLKRGTISFSVNTDR